MPKPVEIVIREGDATDVQLVLPAGGGWSARGRAISSAGDLAPGAWVAVLSETGAHTVVGRTDGAGRFEIGGLHGDLKVTIASESEHSTVECSPRGRLALDLGEVRLEPSPMEPSPMMEGP